MDKALYLIYIKVLKEGYRIRQTDLQLWQGKASLNSVYNFTLKKKKRPVIKVGIKDRTYESDDEY